MPVRTTLKLETRVPTLIAGWPGMGNVGIGATDYLRQKLGGELCARIDVTRYVFPEAVEVADGIGRIPQPPAHNIYLIRQPPVLVFEGESQVGGEAGVAIADELLDYARQAGVETIYTGAAFALPMSYRDPVRVFGVATDDTLLKSFPGYGVEPLAQGRISGLNGVLLGLAGSRGLPAACFLATMPHYAVQTPNPKSSKAVLRVFEHLLGTTVDMHDIDDAISETDRLLGEFETRVNAALQAMKQQAEAGDEESTREEENPEPHEVMDRIEELFEEVGRDRSKAGMLKERLDRWGLFKLYEDRFLDIFDKNQNNR